jgi:hypothetical protein
VGSPTTKRQHGDLAWGEHPEGRAPETRAATRVELGALAVRAQSVHHRLIESDEEVERPDLPAVGVPGNGPTSRPPSRNSVT